MEIIQGQTITRSALVPIEDKSPRAVLTPQEGINSFVAMEQAKIAAEVSDKCDKPLLRVDATDIDVIMRGTYNLVVVTFTPFWGE